MEPRLRRWAWIALLAACGNEQELEPTGTSGDVIIPAEPLPTPPLPAGSGGRGGMPDDDLHRSLLDPHESPGAALGETLDYAGVIRLAGDLAAADEGVLFVSVMRVGDNRPLGSTKIDLSEPSSGSKEADERLVPFVLGGVSVADQELELQVRFDLDGYVDTKEQGGVLRSFPVSAGDAAIDVTLAP